jgi:CheY-like chemotaxis protein
MCTTEGEKAFDLIQKAMPDVVILDIFLPNVDGLTILKRLKAPIDIDTGKPSKTKDIPIIVLTGKAPMIENLTRVEGAIDFFIKPLDTEKLFQRLFSLLEVVHEREKAG